MRRTRRKLAVLQVAALGWDFCAKHVASKKLPAFKKTRSVFPALAGTTAASVRAGTPPERHGMVANGLFFRDLRKVMFHEQAATLVAGPRFWDETRRRDATSVAMLFWPHSLGECVDMVLSPRPIPRHGGHVIQDCLSRPENLYADISEKMRRDIKQSDFRGPKASAKRSSQAVMSSLEYVMEIEKPDLLLGYLPHLDFDLQRFGPEHAKARAAAKSLRKVLTRFLSACDKHNYDYVIYGDYAMTPVRRGAVFPNRRLMDVGLFRTRMIKGMLYPDFYHYEAFAMVDHEVAHVYVADPEKVEFVRRTFTGLPGVAKVWTREEAAEVGLNHPRSGEVILLAEPGAWFAYPWWTEKSETPEFARYADGQDKPGADPCELFGAWPPGTISQDTTKVRGTHGRSSEVAWATSLRDLTHLEDLAALGAKLASWSPDR
jgi:predicted AlkP superfamily pyrophosphatase or phosphodiesterase